ncbi:MAG: efflux RND transporter permease subunit, partial [Pseudomonadota bacterium]
ERGIDKIEFTGLRAPELQVEVPERELRKLGLSVGDVSQMIETNSLDMPSGQTEGQVEQQIRAVADYKRPSALGEIEISSFASGEKVRLSEIGEIHFGYEDGLTQGFTDGQRAIQLTVQRAPTADTLATAAILDNYLEELQQGLPPGISVGKYDVAADSLMERLMMLIRNGLGGLVIVVSLLFIFLNARVAFWVAAGIPVALLATVGFMMLLGQTINMISLFGLIMMLGIIVDDAIVVGEHTATRFSEGDTALEAAETGARRMMLPVMAAMITTAAAFAPILLIRDTIGQIMGVLPFVVISVLIASLIECFLILPGHLAHALAPKRRAGWSYLRHLVISFLVGAFVLMASSRAGADGSSLSIFNQLAAARSQLPLPFFILLLAAASFLVGAAVEGVINLIKSFARRGKGQLDEIGRPEDNWFRRNFDAMFGRFRDGPFASLVALSFNWRYVTVSIAVSLLMVIALGLFVLGGRVSFVFFPSPEAENMFARVVFNAGIPEERAIAVLGELENSLRDTEEKLTGGSEQLVAAYFTTLGSAGRNTGDNLAQMRVQLTTSERRTIRTKDIISAWRKNLPDLAGVKRISVIAARGGPPGRDIDLKITGGDVDTLKQASAEIIDMVSAVPGTSGVADDLPYGKPELVLKLTPRGTALGFSVSDVGRQVRDAFEGAIPRRFALGDDEVTIRVTQSTRQQGGAALRNFELRSPAGEFVPLAEIVDLEEKQGFSAIIREDGQTTVSITADLATDVMTTENAIEILRNGPMPAIAERYGLSWEFGGRAEERKKAFEDLGLGVMIALTVIYIILAWTFSNYWRPFAIMLIIPFGIVGAILGHWLLGYSISVLSFISLLGLAGILVNDSIVLVSRLDERLGEGQSLDEAAVGASKDRLRAVLLTSLTTIGGLIPLMFEKSIQAQFIVPMAVTIIFGLGMATLLVLFLVPAFVGIGADINLAIRTIFSNRKPAGYQGGPAE